METEHFKTTFVHSEKYRKYELKVFLNESWYQKASENCGIMKNCMEWMTVSVTFKNKPLDLNKSKIERNLDKLNHKTYMLKFEDHQILVSDDFVYYLNMF